jgi:hypothetical protein
VSAADRQRVFSKAGYRCRPCGVGVDEPGPDGRKARLTVGHYLPKAPGGTDDRSNRRAECSTCNEAMRHLTEQPIDPKVLRTLITELPRRQKE